MSMNGYASRGLTFTPTNSRRPKTLEDGLRVGKLQVLWPALSARKPQRWVCKCDCGNRVDLTAVIILGGKTTSCGCDHQWKTHGLSDTVEYQTWLSMIKRCENQNHHKYPRYGGRGIKICERWRTNFENFYADMGQRPSDKHSIDRIDNDGHYEPGNCRWATWSEQRRNQSRKPRQSDAA
jgi:hypothetical protein